MMAIAMGRRVGRLILFAWLCVTLGWAAGPQTTLVQDVVYRADGSAATGALVITWPAFVTSDGAAVAAGSKTVTLGGDGSFQVALAPNAGATPSNSYYAVTYKLDGQATSKEAWMVPSGSGAKLAAVRATTVPSQMAIQALTSEWANANLMTVASAQTVSGQKTFSSSPSVPTPVNANDAVNKQYVDQNAGGLSTAQSHAWTQPQTGTDWISSKTPAIDIRSYGAVVDGVTDMSAAFKSALADACSISGVVYMPCTGNGCYMASPYSLGQGSGNGLTNNFACNNRNQVQVKLQGKIIANSTVQWPDGAQLVCEGGGNAGQFTSNGPNCSIVAPQAKGTMGTSITAGNNQTFTPTFSLGSMSNFAVNSAISIIDNTTLTLTSISRANNMVTAVTSSPCRVPPGTVISIAGVTDGTGTSFNTTPMLITADWQTCTFTWSQTGADGAGVVANGTMKGVNDDSFETVVISAISGNTLTASFAHNHAANAEWGMVGLMPSQQTFGQHIFKGVNVTNNWGAGWWLNHNGEGLLEGVGGAANAYGPSIPLEIASAFNWSIKHSSFVGTVSHFCTSNCGEQSYPEGVRITSELNAADPANLNLNFTDDTFITGGVKIDTNNLNNGLIGKFGGIMFRNITIEQPMQAGIVVDPRGSFAARTIVLDNVFLQDNFMGYKPYLVAYTDRGGGGFHVITLNQSLLNGGNGANAVAGQNTLFNQYYQGRVLVEGVDAFNGNLDREPRIGAPLATILDGRTIEGEIRGSGANMSASLIPYATSAVVTDPSAWSCSGNCSITTGVLAPDGSTNAAELLSTTNLSPFISPFSYNGTTAAGDWILYGGWTKGGTLNYAADGSSYGGVFSLHSYGTGEAFDFGGQDQFSSNFQSPIYDSAWHPVVVATKITTAATGTHGIQFRMYGAGFAGGGTQFFMPFFIRVPASAGVPDKEIARWREQLLHGVVPPGMPAAVLAVNPALKMYFGSDTNLYRSGANTLQTDDTFVASGGVIAGSGSKVSAEFKGTGTLTFSSIAAPGCQEQALTVTGASAGDACFASTGASDVGSNFFYGGCRVSASNTAQVKVCATTTGTPPAVSWTGWVRH